MNGKELDLSISEDQSNADLSAGRIETVEVEALGEGSLPSAQESTTDTEDILSTAKQSGARRERRLSPAREELKRRLLPIGSNAAEDRVQTSPLVLQDDTTAAGLVHDEKQKNAAIKIQSAQRQRQAKAEVDEIRHKNCCHTENTNVSRGRAARKRVQKFGKKNRRMVAQKEEPLNAQDLMSKPLLGYTQMILMISCRKVVARERII